MAAMGIGNVGQPGVIFKRKFRWALEITTPTGVIPKHYVKVAGRPKLEVDDTEINFLNAVTWIPGKARWQPISVTYRDVANDDAIEIYNWVSSIYDFNNDTELRMNEKAGWNSTAKLDLYDGCGNVLETWELKSCWPQSIDFGELDYESSEEVTIELQLRYSEVKYENKCGKQISTKCKGCKPPLPIPLPPDNIV